MLQDCCTANRKQRYHIWVVQMRCKQQHNCLHAGSPAAAGRKCQVWAEALLWAAPGEASTGRSNASKQCANHYHMVLEENVVAQHERSLHRQQQPVSAQVSHRSSNYLQLDLDRPRSSCCNAAHSSRCKADIDCGQSLARLE